MRKYILFIFCMFFGLVISSQHTSAQTIVSDEQLEQVRENFLQMGIDEETATKLVEKVRNGELLDSQKPDELDKKREDLVVSLTEGKKYIEFSDGSRIEISVSNSSPVVTTFDYATGTVSYNSCQSGSGYKNCTIKVRYYDGIWDIYFNAKISLVQDGYDMISSIYNQGVDAVLYTVVEKRFEIVQKVETSSVAAKADYTNQFTHKSGLYTLSRTLTLYVENDNAYARLNYY